MLSILLVDDYEETLQTLSLLYRMNDMVGNIYMVRNAAQMWRVLKSGQKIDLVSLDISLGTENGLELCKEVHNQFPELFVVMCSLDESEDNRLTAMKAGASSFIAKPVGRSDIQHTIQACLAHGHGQPSPADGSEGWIGDLLDRL